MSILLNSFALSQNKFINMKIREVLPGDSAFPEAFKHLPQPPRQIYVLSNDFASLLNQPLVAIVGSRKASSYGRLVTQQLATELATAGAVIISGLALGIDSIGHQAALDASGQTIAILPCGLDKIYPATHYHLAKNILVNGGALISEYQEGTEPRKENFIARNRLIAALGQGIIITEAAINSGSLHTARFALEQGKTVMAVPGSITSALSQGTNNLIKAGAVPVTSAEDVLNALELKPAKPTKIELLGASAEEQRLLDLLAAGQTDSSNLLASSGLSTEVFNQTLTMLEINGQIRPVGGGHWALVL